MPITLQDAINQLYDVAVVQGKSQSTSRLDALADYCIQELAARGLSGANADQDIPGGGRVKNWDVAWEYDQKHRLAISLKSILRNVSGTVPNRIDDLMGEVANAQLYSPEIVIGYIMIIDIGKDAYSPKHKMKWSELLKSRLNQLSGRRAPSWTVGMIEAHAIAEVNFSSSGNLLSGEDEFRSFFDVLATQVGERNPNVQPRIALSDL